MSDWEDTAEETYIKMENFLQNAAVLPNPKLTVGNSDDDIDKILFELSWQVDPVLPST